MRTEKFGFSGRIGHSAGFDPPPHTAPVWRYERRHFEIAVSGDHARTASAWHNFSDRPTAPSVFATGSLYLGSDGDFGESTQVTALPLDSAPDVIARRFEAEGPSVFALLDGDFSLVLSDPKSDTVYLVVDKLGCNDIYLRQDGESLFFASDPSELIAGDERFDPVAVSFLLAHEGFVPAPFTVSPNVCAVGRSRFAKISTSTGKLRLSVENYWSPQARWKLPTTKAARAKMFTLLNDAISVRQDSRTALLLSGGVDSSVILNLASGRNHAGPGKQAMLALTGSVKGWDQGEGEIAHSRSIATDFGIPHTAVVLDPRDETLPEESLLCTTSWMSGARLTLPLWRRFALHLRERLGEGYNIIAGQTADTLADNNYTCSSPGYRIRRALFSPWGLRLMPLLSAASPRPSSSIGRATIAAAKSVGGVRISRMVESILGGMAKREAFYAGRLFGYGEMPGTAAGYFPMLTQPGFARVVDWYSTNFIRPLVQDLDAASFYRQMIQLSMDMNMLHLDSRLLFHVYRQEGGRAQLPFMDARAVTYFGSLPYSARAIYREPKHVIRALLRRNGMRYRPRPDQGSSKCSKSQEQLLLEGTIGAYYRELLRAPVFPDRVPRIFEFLDEQYVGKQLTSFVSGKGRPDYRFIAKAGTLEVWSRALSQRQSARSSLCAAGER
jgi:hypothetical protein